MRRTTGPKPGRNQPCPCGSGKKHKKCCGAPAHLRPKVKPVRSMPSPLVVPKEQRAPGPDGMPAIVTPRDMDPLGHKDIITPGDIEGLAKQEERRESQPKEPLIIPEK